MAAAVDQEPGIRVPVGLVGQLRSRMTGAPGHDPVSGASRPGKRRLPLLSEPEAVVVAGLLDELAGRCPDVEALGELAAELAGRILERLGV